MLTFARRLRREKDDTIRMLSSALSTRQLIRICRRLAYFADEDLYKAIHKAALSRFMPIAAKTVLHELMIANGIYPAKNETPLEDVSYINFICKLLLNLTHYYSFRLKFCRRGRIHVKFALAMLPSPCSKVVIQC